jgi:uncharacterized protein involved in exopolysaccharide biosynthesis
MNYVESNIEMEPRASVAAEEEDGVDLLDIALVLVTRWRRIALLTIAATVLGVAYSLMLKPTFTATASILPPQQQQSSAGALAGQLGLLLGAGGGGLGLKSPADLYVGILQSRTIADRIIAKFGLMSVYKTKNMQDTRAALKRSSQLEAARDGLIEITVVDGDPKRASAIANDYVDELYAVNSTLAISEAAQRRVFFDQQLAEERSALTAAESDLKATEERTGLILLGDQAQSTIRGIANVEAEISSREVQLQADRAFDSDENPDVVRLQQEIATLRHQLAGLQNDQQRLAPGDTQLPADRVPGVGLEYARKLRDVKYHEALVDLLSRQYEAARIDEARSAPIIQVIDRAVPPDRKSGPHRLVIAVGFGFLGLVLSCFWSYLADGWSRVYGNPTNSAKLRSILANSAPNNFGKRVPFDE